MKRQKRGLGMEELSGMMALVTGSTDGVGRLVARKLGQDRRAGAGAWPRCRERRTWHRRDRGQRRSGKGSAALRAGVVHEQSYSCRVEGVVLSQIPAKLPA